MAPESRGEVIALRPHRWVIPRLWPGERCFVICGGESLNREAVRRIRGRIIAVKHAAKLRPDADVLFWAGKDSLREMKEEGIIPGFRGMMVSRGDYPGTPREAFCVSKAEYEYRSRLSTDPRILAGWDSGGAALNLAFLFGANPIILIGMDMTGGHWFKGHPKPWTGKGTHDRHRSAIEGMAKDLKAAGVMVYNTSPISKLKCFERRALSDFL